MNAAAARYTRFLHSQERDSRRMQWWWPSYRHWRPVAFAVLALVLVTNALWMADIVAYLLLRQQLVSSVVLTLALVCLAQRLWHWRTMLALSLGSDGNSNLGSFCYDV